MTEVARDSGGPLGMPNWKKKKETPPPLWAPFHSAVYDGGGGGGETSFAVSYCHYTTADNSGKSEADLRLPPPAQLPSLTTIYHEVVPKI